MSPSIADNYRAFAIDLDGVVWRGESMIDGSANALNAIKRSGKRLLLLTNSGSYTPSVVRERLLASGVDIDEGDVLNSAMAARDWFGANGFKGKRALVLGVRAVADQVSSVVKVSTEPPVEVVLVARDTTFSFERLALVSELVRAGARLVALNSDRVMPLPNGALAPGTGAILAAIEVASGVKAVIIGKPHEPMMRLAKERLGDGPVLMVGDSARSDVAGAILAGWDSALVSTGVPADLDGPAATYIVESLASLF